MKKQVAYLQKLFYDLWNDFGSVYLIVSYSDRTVIGKRGFTDEEKERGLVLVFNDKTSSQLEWDGEGNLACVLAFGARKEDVWIHHDDLLGVFSHEAGLQFVRTDISAEKADRTDPGAAGPVAQGGDAGRVVSMNDFKKQRTKGTS